MKKIILIFMIIFYCLFTFEIFANVQPIQIDEYTKGDKSYIVKTYDIDGSVDENTLIEEFKANELEYSYVEINVDTNKIIDKKDIIETKTLTLPTNNANEIKSWFGEQWGYNVDGYSGKLFIDLDNLHIEPTSYENKEWYEATSKVYSNLMFKDESVISKSIKKNGNTYYLASVSWNVTERALNGVGEIVPTKYTATAKYLRKFSSSNPKEYKITANYLGVVTKEIVENKIVEITYVADIPEVSFMELYGSTVFSIIIFIISIILLIVALYIAYKIYRSKKGVIIKNLMDNGVKIEYIELCKMGVDYEHPVIDLNIIKNEIQSSNFLFILDKYTTKKLFGKVIRVTLNETSHMIEVENLGKEFNFKLLIGDYDDLSVFEKEKNSILEETVEGNSREIILDEDAENYGEIIEEE